MREITIVLAWMLVVFACGGDDDGNVSVGGTCEFVACGGDPTGEWEYTGGCVETLEDEDLAECDSVTGSISGSLSITESGYSRDVLLEYRGCGWISESDSGGGGSATITGNTIQSGTSTFEFCVQDDTMTLYQTAGREPDDPLSYTLRRAQ